MTTEFFNNNAAFFFIAYIGGIYYGRMAINALRMEIARRRKWYRN